MEVKWSRIERSGHLYRRRFANLNEDVGFEWRASVDFVREGETEERDGPKRADLSEHIEGVNLPLLKDGQAEDDCGSG
jgi:hypothetical protein